MIPTRPAPTPPRGTTHDRADPPSARDRQSGTRSAPTGSARATKGFGSALERLEGEGRGRLVTGAKGAAPDLAARVLSRKGAPDERGDGSGAALPTPAHATGTLKPVDGTAPPAALDHATVDRMAAAIADRASTTTERASVQFAPGGIVEGAIVSRDAGGALSVRLTGFDPRIGAAAADALRRDLAAALRDRKLRVTTLDLVPADRSRDRSDPQAG